MYCRSRSEKWEAALKKTQSNAPQRANLLTALTSFSKRNENQLLRFVTRVQITTICQLLEQWSNLSCRIYTAFPNYLLLFRGNNCHVNASQCDVYTSLCLSFSLIEGTDSNHATVMKHVCVCIIQHGKSNSVGLSLERSFIVAIFMVVKDVDMEWATTCQKQESLSYVCFQRSEKYFSLLESIKKKAVPV